MFHFVPLPSDEYKIVVPVLDMVDVDEGFILTVGLLGFEMLRHINPPALLQRPHSPRARSPRER